MAQRQGESHKGYAGCLEHRLLPDRLQVLDLINRRDLDRKIKTLRSIG